PFCLFTFPPTLATSTFPTRRSSDLFPGISLPFVLQWRFRRLARPALVEWTATTHGADARNPAASVVPEISLRRQNATRSCPAVRSEEHTSELQSPDHIVCRLLLEKK